MAIYVGLTLILAIVAVVSIRISSRLSRDTLKASDRQSKDTIEAVNRQITASEKQAQEALYNQHKPIVIPVTIPLSKALILDSIRNNQPFTFGIRNKGAGVALNVFSILGLDGFADILC